MMIIYYINPLLAALASILTLKNGYNILVTRSLQPCQPGPQCLYERKVQYSGWAIHRSKGHSIRNDDD